MSDRQFRWGLSGGVSVLAIAGFFWFGISFGVITTQWGWWAWSLSTAFQIGISGAILWAAALLRRRSGFEPREVRRGDHRQRRITQRILRAFSWIIVAETVLIGAAVWWCIRLGARMIWPAIGLIVSIHFAPLARLFHVRAYYATAAAGAVISLASFAGLAHNDRVAWLGGGMATVMWVSGWYIIQNADGITARAVLEHWEMRE